jgi:hypothetical protein
MDFFSNTLITLSLPRRKKRRMRRHTALSRLQPWLRNSFRGAPQVLRCSLRNNVKIGFLYATVRNCRQCFWRKVRVCHMLLLSRPNGWLLCESLRGDRESRMLCPFTLFYCDLGKWQPLLDLWWNTSFHLQEHSLQHVLRHVDHVENWQEFIIILAITGEASHGTDSWLLISNKYKIVYFIYKATYPYAVSL